MYAEVCEDCSYAEERRSSDQAKSGQEYKWQKNEDK